MSTDQKEIKEKASKIISGIFNLTEKGVHAIIDKGNTLTHNIDKKVSDTYNSLVKNLEKFMNEFEETNLETLCHGELVISPVDIIVFDKVEYKAGVIFRFDEKIIPFVKAKLYKPHEEAIIDWATKVEIQYILGLLKNNIDMTSLNKLLSNRIASYEEKK